jgi:hypothetical protein
MFGSYSGRAGGNISPARFVKRSSSSGESVITQCSASSDQPWGISQRSTRRMALSGWDDGYAAVSGDDINVFGPGDDECMLELSGTVATGGNIESDANGCGQAATGDKDKVGAIALEDGVSGQLIRVKPVRFDLAV